jgi:D-sedoheptulose 7-phosphate isomerase
MQFFQNYFNEIKNSIFALDSKKINLVILELKKLRKRNGRLFIIGIGGSAANASHAVNDFRKLCMINAISPVDNISEITARTNDDGFENIFFDSLEVSNINKQDLLLIFSVGGGNLKKNISVNIINAIKLAKKRKLKIISIIGKKDGYAYENSDICLLINIKDKKFITPISESMQSIIWHYFVSHPLLQIKKTKW